ncbi:MAG: HEAT repeat domain-containing protein [Promethearchaeota archaeon]
MSASLESLLRDGRIDLILSKIKRDSSIISEVIEQLSSKIRSIRFNSILILGKLGENSQSALPGLASCLEDDDWSICREAVRSLGNLGDMSKEAVSKLAKMIINKEVTLRKEVAISLGKIGYQSPEVISSLITATRDTDEDVRIEATRSLGMIGLNSSEALATLINRLDDISWKVRAAAAISIGQIGQEIKESVPPLLIALGDRDWRVRHRAINSLKLCAKNDIPLILTTLDKEKFIVKKGIIEVLGEIKRDDPEIINAINTYVYSNSAILRGEAIEALRIIGKRTLLFLLEAIIKSSNRRRILIIASIGAMEVDLTDKIPKIIEIFEKSGILRPKRLILEKPENLKKFNEKFKYYFKLLSNRILSSLNNAYSKTTSVRVQISRTLGKIGHNSELAIDVLIEALKDPMNIVRRTSALAVGNLGANAQNAIPALIAALHDRESEVRWRAAEALGKIGIMTPEIETGLEMLYHDKYDYVSTAADFALDLIKRNQ